MRHYAMVTSERASKGQGGEWLDIAIYTTSRENPTHRIKVWSDDRTGNTMIDLYTIHFGRERQIARDVVYTNVPDTKGEKQKGECAYTSVDGAFCTTHNLTH